MAAFHEPEECLRGHAAHFGQRLADGCQGRCDKGGRKAVIGTDHAHVHRHGLPSFAQRGVTAEGVNVVTGEDRRWWVREVEQGERLVVAVPGEEVPSRIQASSTGAAPSPWRTGSR